MLSLLRRILIGHPLATDRIEHEKLGKAGGMAIFAADPMSSVAYGPEEVLLVLLVAGAAGMRLNVLVCVAIAVLIGIVATSYRQTVIEYPSGGGAYVVARENLGPLASHIAGAALLIDYVLTVAVSVAAGIAAITSAVPALYHHRVLIAGICVALIALGNLRGLRESAAAFALPVYGFVVCAVITILAGLWQLARGSMTPDAPLTALPVLQPLTMFLVLRAFSSGCVSLTGIEAVANGVQAFREPRGRNAAAVMVYLAVILAATVVGVAILAHQLNVVPRETETVLSQVGAKVFGRHAMYYVLQTLTALILIFAANTSFSGFPRLSAFMARDGFLPRQMANLGDRLVFSNGIVILAVLAVALIVAFQGDVTRLIPLYAVGVFTAFTASQAGMVLHWKRQGGRNWRAKALLNGFGAFCTGVVLIVVAVTKFVYGAWIVCILIPLVVLAFQAIARHYRYVASRLSLERAGEVRRRRNLNLLLVGGMHRGTLEALEYVRALGGPVRAIHIEAEGETEPRIQRLWDAYEKEMPLIIIPSPYRNLAVPLAEYIRQVRSQEHYDTVTVVLPEFIVDTWWESLLHNHSALWLQFQLRSEPGVAVVNMRYRL
jgi:amino acid transporter